MMYSRSELTTTYPRILALQHQQGFQNQQSLLLHSHAISPQWQVATKASPVPVASDRSTSFTGHRGLEDVNSMDQDSTDDMILRQTYTLVNDQAQQEAYLPKKTTKSATDFLGVVLSFLSPDEWWRYFSSVTSSLIATGGAHNGPSTTLMSSVDIKVCQWLSICGGHSPVSPNDKPKQQDDRRDRHDVTKSDQSRDWQYASPADYDSNRLLTTIPEYVMEYAPLVHLYSGEEFWPCDMAEHLIHTTPNLNYTAISSRFRHPSLENLDKLNKWQNGRFVFLQSNDNVEERPDWLGGAKNIPLTNVTYDGATDHREVPQHPGRQHGQGSGNSLKDWTPSDGTEERYPDKEGSRSTGETSPTPNQEGFRELDDHIQIELKRQLKQLDESTKNVRGGRSEAPAVLIVVDKGHGIVDAFWFFFYSYNLGNKVLNLRFGNHVGDWEHSAIRFHNGKPKAVFFSEHNFGSAYSYAAVEKIGRRPIIYSATGTHAMYATAGTHPYVLPLGLLHDQTDKGPLWDPLLNSHSYMYDVQHDILKASDLTPNAPIGWFHFSGHWGDKIYPFGDRRQYRLAGQYHYVNGPLGPKFKNLGRKKICGGPDSHPCVIKHWLGGSSRIPRWQGNGEEADAFSAHAKQD